MKTKTILLFLLTWSAFVNAQNLVAYYPFNGNSNDESANLNHGTVNGPVLTTDRFGNLNSAYEFDGIDDFILVTNSASLNIYGSDLSITYWLFNDNPSLTDTSYKGISKGGWSTSAGYELIYSNYWNAGTLHFTTGASANNVLSFNNYNNQWLMVTGTYEHETATKKVYINGIEQTTTVQGADDLSSSLNDLYIGRRHPANTYAGFVKGKIDDIRIYSSLLTPTDILNLYNFNSLNRNEIAGLTKGSFYVFNQHVYFNDDCDLSEIKKVEVYNMMGQIVFSTATIENHIPFNVSNDQLYILKVILGNGNFQTLKFAN